MPVLPRLQDEVREPVEELMRREFDDAVGPRTRRFLWSAGPDPVGRLMSRQHVADAGDAAVCAADHREPLQCEGGPGAIPQQVFETPKIARHIAIDERDPDAYIDRDPAVIHPSSVMEIAIQATQLLFGTSPSSHRRHLRPIQRQVP